MNFDKTDTSSDGENSLRKIFSSFSITEKVIFYILSIIFLISALFLLWKINESYEVEVPVAGGTLQEGVTTYPRYINPLLSVTDSGKDLSELVYSGLFKNSPNGNLIPDLAENYTVSSDGLTYTVNLKKNIYFQDNTPITADDIVYTIGKTQDPAIKSPVAPNWAGVTVNKINSSEVQFVLKSPYAPFLQNLTLGILPKHIWEKITDDEFTFTNYNTEPVGSGPYEIKSIKTDNEGLPLYYRLVPFNKYALGQANISNVIIRFYKSEADMIAAYKSGEIDSMSGIDTDLAASLKNNSNQIISSELPRTFAVFFNQSEAPVLSNKEVRVALNQAVNRQELIDNVLNGYGTPVTTAVPEDILNMAGATSTNAVASSSTQDGTAAAIETLTSNGWTMGPDNVMIKKTKKDTQTLSFSISTSNAPDLKEAALTLQSEWQKIGAHVDLKFFDVSDLNQNVIQGRKYDALLFGEVLGRNPDLYAFWHSSQIKDPGLNIAGFTDIKADKLLESARAATSTKDEDTDYLKFEQELETDTPAVFLYAPDFIYIVPKDIHNLTLGQIGSPEERFANINTWYIDTDKIWKIFKH